MTTEKMKEIFKSNYDYSNNNIDQVLLKLRGFGATQASCVKLLMTELNLSIQEADKIVVSSSAWSDIKGNTLKLREDFGDFLENSEE